MQNTRLHPNRSWHKTVVFSLTSLLVLNACGAEVSGGEDTQASFEASLDTSSDTTVTFEDLNGGVALSSYGGITWGTGAGGWMTWYDGDAPPYTMTAYVNSLETSEVTTTFELPPGQVLKSVKLASFEGAPATVKISSPGNPERVRTGIGRPYQAVALDWTAAASTVTVTVTCAGRYGAADVLFDDFVYGPIGDGAEPEPVDPSDGVVWEPIDLAQTRAQRDAFDWNATAALSEAPVYDYTVDGEGLQLPAMHYVQIYVRNPDELRELEEVGIHYDLAPLFDSEWPETDTSLVLPFAGDPEDGGGQFAFALLPAPVYNALRAESLAGEDTFKAVILRAVPAEANAGDGTVSWDFILQNMTSYAPLSGELTDQGEVVPEIGEDDATATSEKRLGRRFRQALRRVAQIARGSVDLVRRAIGAAANLVTRETVLHIETTLNNRTRAPLVRAWDDGFDPSDTSSPRGFGKPLTLKGLRVNVSGQSRLTLYKATLDEHGRASVAVPRTLRVNICFEADSPAAKFESGILRPVLHCWPRHRPRGDSDPVGPRAVGDTEFYTMAQLIDARDYATRVLGFTPPKATIQAGPFAQLLTKGDAGDAYVPCLAATKAPVSIVNAYAALLNLVPGAGSVTEFLFTTDIIMRESTRRSRNTPVHEYGHFVFCTLLADTRMQAFNVVWSQVLTLHNLDADASTPVKALNEGFADWFASQVTGSVNYFNPPDSTGERFDDEGRPTGNAFIGASAAANGEGMEANIGGPACSEPGCFDASGWTDRARVIGTVATILHDAIDRQDCGADAACRAEGRSDAAVWNTSTDPFTPVHPLPLDHVGDEAITLSPRDITDAVRDFANQNWAFGSALSYENFYRALSEKMDQRGHSDDEICDLFALHRTDGDCREWLDDSDYSVTVGFRAQRTPVDPNATDDVGTVEPINPAGTCTSSSCTVPTGSVVTFLALPEAGFTFSHWSGCSTSTSAMLSLSNVEADTECVANFKEFPSVIVFTVSASAGSNGGGTVMPAMTTVRSGEGVTLQATPDAGHHFLEWIGSPQCAGTNPDLVIAPVTSNVSCIASFGRDEVTVSFSVLDGGSGTIEASGASAGGCTASSCSLPIGSSVTLTALPSPGYLFAGWTGCASQPEPVLQLSNVTINQSCTASFVRAYRVTYSTDWPATATAAVRFGSECNAGACTVVAGGGVDLSAFVDLPLMYVDRWTCTESGTGRVVTSAGEPYPEYISLISIENDWSCHATTLAQPI